jgi:ribosomal protein S18 acetylase RimI-like enzyme
VIRDAAETDTPAVLALWQAADATPSVTDTEADVRRAIAASPAVVLVAEEGGQIVGTVVAGFDGWRGNLYRLAVYPGVRRRGVARDLVTEAEQRLIAGGARRITALVEHQHDVAVGFWAAVGYVHDERIARYVRTLERRGGTPAP